jgi:hypothetical protein
MCRSSSSVKAIEHYYNNNYFSSVLDSSDRSVGITNAIVSTTNNNLVCNFTRDNTNNKQNYFQISNNTKTSIIVAYGPLSKIIFN